MKTINMKKTAATFLMLSTLTFAGALMAETIDLPIISRPSVLDEGTQRELSESQIGELLPWAKDSKLFLNDLLDNIGSLSITDKIDRLVEGIKTVVGESSPKNSELLMRYALNRGLVIVDVLNRETSADAVGTSDAKLRVLVASAKMAISYYDKDMEILTKKSRAPYVLFGADYFEFLTEINKSIFDASAQYSIQRTALEWLQWDLYRDLNNTSYAAQIVKINNSLKVFPNKKMHDAQSIAFIRQMKKLSTQLRIKEVLAEKDRAFRESEEARVKAENDAQQARLNRERDEKAKLKVGDVVIWAGQYENSSATVAAIQDNGLYTIRYSNGLIQSNLERTALAVTFGCSGRFCVGENSVLLKNNYNFASVTIVGLQLDGKYIIKFNNTELASKLGEGWGTAQLAKLSGCSSENICVGDKMINTTKNATVIVVGLQTDNRYLLKFTSTGYSGQLGGDWTKKDLVKDSLK